MPFTPEEIRKWHSEKRKLDNARWREVQPAAWRDQPVAICIHCQNPFGISEGSTSGEVAICDICMGN